MKKNLLKSDAVQSLIASFLCIILGLLIGFGMNVICILLAWLKGGRKENADEIIEIIREQFSVLKNDMDIL